MFSIANIRFGLPLTGQPLLELFGSITEQFAERDPSVTHGGSITRKQPNDLRAHIALHRCE